MKNYNLLSNFVIRTPLLPFAQLTRSFEHVTDIESARSVLKSYFDDPLIRQALYLASPHLHEIYCKSFSNDSDGPDEGLVFTFLKYLARMSTRCTPFGLFASVNLGEWSQESNIVFREKEKNWQYTRLDMRFLCSLVRQLESDNQIRSQLKYYPNSSLYKHGNSLRYIEAYHSGRGYDYNISQVDQSDYLNAVLDRATEIEGSTMTELAELLVDDDVNMNEASEFIGELINMQLLVSELTPNLTGDEYLTKIVEIFEGKKMGIGVEEKRRKELDMLSSAHSIISGINNYPDKMEAYASVEQLLRHNSAHSDAKVLFQVDLSKEAVSCQLSKKVAGSVRKALTALYKLGRFNTNQNLEKFKTSFIARYETREVPLLMALDNELGIGYANSQQTSGSIAPMVDDLAVKKSTNSKKSTLSWGDPEAFYLKKYLAAHQEGSYEVLITDDDLNDSNNVWEETTDTFAVLAQLINEKGDDPLIYLKSGGFGSAASLLGRFTFLDKEIERFTKSITDHEVQLNRDVILASVVHLPKPKFGNFILRKQLYDYEIPFLSRSHCESSHQIFSQDLNVSVENNRIKLWSKKLGKEIIPRLSTAHNYSYASLPVYHFLCDLQFQNKVSPLNFNWGSLKDHYTFLPRVRYKNVILHRATWQFKKEGYGTITSATEQNLNQAIQQWKQKWVIPNHIFLVESDNELFFDLDNPIFQQLFIREIGKKNEIILAECLFKDEESPVKDLNGHTYTNEIILAFGKSDSSPGKITSRNGMTSPVRRKYSIGSEWLYYKIYTGTKSADEILANAVIPLTQYLRKSGKIDFWFFIRYADDAPHLRLRFKLKDNSHLQSVIMALSDYLKPYIQSEVIWKVQTDTYNREIERYGSNTIHIFEELFYRDCCSFAEIIKLAENSGAESDVLLFAGMMSIDSYLSDFGFDLLQKRTFVENAKNGFNKEFGTNRLTTKQLRKKYEKLVGLLDQVNSHTSSSTSQIWQSVKQIFCKRSKDQNELITELLQLKDQGELQIDLKSGIWCLIHMSINRLATSKARKHEWLFYNLLYRYLNEILNRDNPSVFVKETEMMKSRSPVPEPSR